MAYDFIPISHRKPLKWPKGARLALIVTLNLEYWDLVKDTDGPYYAGGPPVLPDPLPGNVADFPNFTWREYGQRVGIWRMIDTFDAAGVPASCTMNAKMGLERRAVIDAVNERGWELVAHNYEQGDLLTNYTFAPDKERTAIRDALGKITAPGVIGDISFEKNGDAQLPGYVITTKNGQWELLEEHKPLPCKK